MKRNFLTLVFAGCLSAFAFNTSFAQTGVESEQQEKRWNKADRKKGGQNMESLNLTDDQKAKVKAIRADYKVQAEKIKNTPLTADERKSQMKALHQSEKEKIKAILTPEQAQQMEANKEKKKERFKNKRNNRRSVS